MLHELTPAQHANLRPLFAGFGLRLHGLVEAVFSGEFGRAWANDRDKPTVALANIDFWLVAGDTIAPEADDAIRLVPQGALVTDGSQPWDALVRRALADRIVERTRTGMRTPPPDAWDRDHLHALAAAVPTGLEIRPIDRSNIAALLAVAKDFASNWRSIDDAAARGIAFGAFEGDHCVAGCGSYTLANGKLEIEIDTKPEHRRRGLARALAATLIEHCLNNGIEPCWDAHNPESASLALQLGFTDPSPYTVFVVT